MISPRLIGLVAANMPTAAIRLSPLRDCGKPSPAQYVYAVGSLLGIMSVYILLVPFAGQVCSGALQRSRNLRRLVFPRPVRPAKPKKRAASKRAQASSLKLASVSNEHNLVEGTNAGPARFRRLRQGHPLEQSEYILRYCQFSCRLPRCSSPMFL